MKENISRRNFLTGMAATGALATIGLAGCSPSNQSSKATADEADANTSASNQQTGADWLGSSPEITDIAETKTTDLLIIGAGNGGLGAAAVAADLGADFMICEKSDSIQRSRHWFGAVNTSYTKEAGVSVNKSQLLNEFSRYASNLCDQKVIRVWIDESSDLVDWIDPILTEAGMSCSFDADAAHETGGTSYYIPALEHYYHGEDASGEPLDRNNVLLDFISEKGYDVSYKHEMVQLEREAGGRVTAAIFDTPDGYVKIEATKGVLLTTGGYAGNATMVKELNPIIPRCTTLNYNSPNCTGDGIKAAMLIGAQKDQNGAPMIFDRGAVKPGENAGYTSDEPTAMFVGAGKQFNLGSQPFMKVTRDGKRFVNESTPYDFCCFAAAEHDGGVWCQIFDSKLKEDVDRFQTIGCSRQTQNLLAQEDDTPIDEIYAEQLEAGTMFKADTIEELADLLGFDGEAKDAFLAEVDRYNEFYDKQEDEDFGKEAYRLSELRNPPFYGGWFGGSLLTTVDGLRINEDMQVLDTDNKVIDGLYASGDCSGSIFGNNYPEYIVGCACGRTLTFSRHAVRHIMGDI